MDIEKVLSRNEIDRRFTWATEDIYPSDEAFIDALAKFRESIDVIKQYDGKAVTDAKSLLEYYNYYASNIPVIDSLMHYSMLKSDQDTSVSKYQDFRSQAVSAYIDYDSANSFFIPQLLTLSEETLNRYYNEEPELVFYKKDIDDKRRLAPHILDEQGEMLLSMAGELINTPENVFSLLSDADLSFEPVIYDGKEYPVTHGTYITLLESPVDDIRKGAFKSMYKTYGQFANTYASLIFSQMKSLAFTAKARKYNSTLEAALDSTNVDTAVYHNLIEAVHNNMDYMYQYVALRKKILKKDELHMYDMYTPLVPEATMKIPFETARNNVMEALKVFGEEYTSVLASGFESRWIDIYENKGKRSGAYSAGCLVHPFVLLNHKDNLDSEFTLAHEMGHAMHSYLSNATQAPIYAEYVIFVAEVASTCNEALLMQYLLKKTTDKKERISLINYFLDQFKGTLYRQAMFAEFELRMNELTAQGASLTADLLKEEYISLVKSYFGDGVVYDEEIALEWARIPHFYYNYYVYQYATGFSAAIALSNQILTEGQPAVDRYLKFLSSGRTQDPVSLLKMAGIDMTTAKPVEDALKLFGDLVKEMDELIN
ncbi:MAG: oligoendopeptidase F [Butyrivibrio sp.]